MQEEYCKDAAESNPNLSCSTLEAYLDAVYDSLDEVFFSKVCVCCLAAPLLRQTVNRQAVLMRMHCCTCRVALSFPSVSGS